MGLPFFSTLPPTENVRVRYRPSPVSFSELVTSSEIVIGGDPLYTSFKKNHRWLVGTVARVRYNLRGGSG